MTTPVAISAQGNTYNPCLLILRSKGYELEAEEDGNHLTWKAIKDGNSYMAYSPPELLGIVILGESFGKDWNQQLPDLLAEVLEK